MKTGDIVLVKFPFTNLETDKKRPALVLNIAKHTDKIQLVTIAMVTSKIDGFKLIGDCPLEQWTEAGLLHPSLVRLSKLTTLELDLIDKSLGHLSEKDFKVVKREFKKLFHVWAG